MKKIYEPIDCEDQWLWGEEMQYDEFERSQKRLISWCILFGICIGILIGINF